MFSTEKNLDELIATLGYEDPIEIEYLKEYFLSLGNVYKCYNENKIKLAVQVCHDIESNGYLWDNYQNSYYSYQHEINRDLWDFYGDEYKDEDVIDGILELAILMVLINKNGDIYDEDSIVYTTFLPSCETDGPFYVKELIERSNVVYHVISLLRYQNLDKVNIRDLYKENRRLCVTYYKKVKNCLHSIEISSKLSLEQLSYVTQHSLVFEEIKEEICEKLKPIDVSQIKLLLAAARAKVSTESSVSINGQKDYCQQIVAIDKLVEPSWKKISNSDADFIETISSFTMTEKEILLKQKYDVLCEVSKEFGLARAMAQKSHFIIKDLNEINAAIGIDENPRLLAIRPLTIVRENLTYHEKKHIKEVLISLNNAPMKAVEEALNQLIDEGYLDVEYLSNDAIFEQIEPYIKLKKSTFKNVSLHKKKYKKS